MQTIIKIIFLSLLFTYAAVAGPTRIITADELQSSDLSQSYIINYPILNSLTSPAWMLSGNAGTGGTGVVGTTDAQPWTTIVNGIYVDSYQTDGSVSSIQNITQPNSTNFNQKRNQVNLSLAAPLTGGSFTNQNNTVGYSSAFDYAGSLSSISAGVDNGSPNTVNYISASENNINLHGGGTTSLVKGIDMNAGITGANVGYWVGIGSYLNGSAGMTGTGRMFEAGMGIANSATNGWDLFGGNLSLTGTTVNTNNVQAFGGSVSLQDTAHSDNVIAINSGVNLVDDSTAGGLTGLNLTVQQQNNSAVSGNVSGISNTIAISNASTNSGVTANYLNLQLQGTSVSGGVTGENISVNQQDASVTSNSSALNINHTFQGTASTTNATGLGVYSNLQNSSTMGSYTGFQVNPVLNDSATVSNLNPLQVSANINGTATVTNPINVAQFNLFSTPVIAGANAVSIDISNTNIVDRVSNSRAISSNGGGLQFGFDYTIPSALGIMFPNNFAQHPVVANGAPVSTLGFLNFFNPNFELHDDWTADFTSLHLGAVNGMFLGNIMIDSGKTMDAYSGILSGLSNPSGAGTLTNFSAFRSAGVLPQGGALVTGTEIGFEAMPSMCLSSGTECWGFRDNSSAENYMGKLAVGTSSKKVASGVKFEVGNGDTQIDGTIRDSSSINSILPTNRELRDSSDMTRYSWGNGQINDSAGLLSIDTSPRQLVNASGGIVADWSSSDLKDNSAVNSLDWNARNLVNSSASPIMNWSNYDIELSTALTQVQQSTPGVNPASGSDTLYFKSDDKLYALDSTGTEVLIGPGTGGGTVTAVTGSSPISSSGGSTPDISITQAGTVSSGYLNSTDWNTFNNKQSALSINNLTASGTDGISVTGGTGAVIGSGTSLAQHVSDSTHNGYLSSADWSTFNGKKANYTEAQEVPSGTINGSNVTFTLAHTPTADATVKLYQDGLFLRQGTDYTLSGATITMTTAPATGQTLDADYEY